MPTFGCSAFWERDPRRWADTLRSVKAEMVAAGWNKHAGKLHEVAFRRARRRFLSQ